jgi:DNA invertase Pin-like site-specific DNA recombinase
VRAGMRRAKLEGRQIGRRPLDIDRTAVLQVRRSRRALASSAVSPTWPNRQAQIFRVGFLTGSRQVRTNLLFS